jgi:peptide/nickel transport system permease protein
VSGAVAAAGPARARRDVLLWLGVVLAVTTVLLAAFGAAVSPFDPTAATPDVGQPPPALAAIPDLLWRSITGRLAAPVHWFGTDDSGLDVFSRVITAPRADLAIALAACALSTVLGVAIGLIAGFFRHWSTELMMRVSDVMQSFPVFISAMILVAMAGRSYVNIVVALALLYTPIYVRLTRAEVLGQVARGYVQAARAIGNPAWRVALTHVLPNALAPAIIQTSVTIGFAILLTAGLSFVGAGVRPPTPEWGLMIANGAGGIVTGEWWSSVFPGIAISLTVFGFAAIGNALEQRYGR